MFSERDTCERGNEDFGGVLIHTTALSLDCKGDYLDLHKKIQEPLSSQVHSTCSLAQFCTVLNNFPPRAFVQLQVDPHVTLFPIFNKVRFRHGSDEHLMMSQWIRKYVICITLIRFAFYQAIEIDEVIKIGIVGLTGFFTITARGDTQSMELCSGWCFYSSLISRC